MTHCALLYLMRQQQAEVPRLDALLEPTKQAVIDMKAALDKKGITQHDPALQHSDLRS